MFVRDGYECYLENSEIVTQAIAWMPLPEPYKPEPPELIVPMDMLAEALLRTFLGRMG